MKEKILEFENIREKMVVYLTPPHAPALVSTVSPFGNYNLAAFEQFMNCSDVPPRVLLAISNDGDTIKNLDFLPEFVVGIPRPNIVNQVLACGEKLPRDESEFELTGLTPTKSKLTQPPRIEECPINFECKMLFKKDAGDHSIVVGDVLLAAVQEQFWNDDKVKRRLGLDLLYYATSGFFFKKGEIIKGDKTKIVEDYWLRKNKKLP